MITALTINAWVPNIVDAWLILKILAAKKGLTLRALLDEMAEEKKREAVTNKS